MSIDHSSPSPAPADAACAAHCPVAAPRVALEDPAAIDAGRRTFLTQSMLAAAALALAACGLDNGPTAPSSVSGSIRVSDYPALANVGGVALVTVSGAKLAVVRTSADTFVALSRICPHQGGTVNPSSNGFTCPVHGARFDLTGQWVGGQPTTNLRAYPTSYDAASGTVTIG